MVIVTQKTPRRKRGKPRDRNRKRLQQRRRKILLRMHWSLGRLDGPGWRTCMKYSEKDLPPLLTRLIKTASASPAQRHTTQSNLAEVDTPAEQQGGTFFDAISLAEALELYSAVRNVRPTASAEIGFCCGGSGLAILKGLEDNEYGIHYACDPYQTTYARNAGLRNVVEAGLVGRLCFHEAFPEAVLGILPRIQFAFIDASHLFDLSVLDFVLIDKRLDVGGVVGFHDLWMPSLRKVVRYILANREYEVYTAPGALPQSPKAGWLRRSVATAVRIVPRAEDIFTQELLRPWAEFGIHGNLALLRKTAEDSRDWRNYVSF